MTEANEELVNTLTLAAILGGLIHVGQQFREHDLKDAFFRRNPRLSSSSRSRRAALLRRDGKDRGRPARVRVSGHGVSSSILKAAGTFSKGLALQLSKAPLHRSPDDDALRVDQEAPCLLAALPHALVPPDLLTPGAPARAGRSSA